MRPAWVLQLLTLPALLKELGAEVIETGVS